MNTASLLYDPNLLTHLDKRSKGYREYDNLKNSTNISDYKNITNYEITPKARNK
jgi:hypothetical protein